MKLVIYFLAFVFTLEAYAESVEGIRPVLRFDKNILRQSKSRSPSLNYLYVSVDDVHFPKGPQREKFYKALGLLEEILNSDEFKSKVLAYQNIRGQNVYSRNYLWRKKTPRLANEDILKLIYNADEKMVPKTKGIMNISAFVKRCTAREKRSRKTKRWCANTIASTRPSSDRWLKLNWKFYSRYSVPEMVGNIVHEWIHLLGFLHGHRTPRALLKQQVPYVVGYIARDMADQLLSKK